jgi:ABC-type Fe3+-hydroxamate transport system substrate-binding protein
MPLYTDQIGNTISIPIIPKRIISLVPSQTELLFYLGLAEEVVGITKFCVHPTEWFTTKTRVGGTKQLNIDTIRQLQPDLIIANKEENVKEQIDSLAKEFPVWISDVNNLPSALQMIVQVGTIIGKKEKADVLIEEIKKAFNAFSFPHPRPKATYLIWHNPYMTVGGDTFIHAMLTAAGFENIFVAESRYPTITIDTLKEKDCQVLLLSSEPFPFTQKHIDELQAHLPSTKILLVDGELFSWYGSRMLKAPGYFETLCNKLK